MRYADDGRHAGILVLKLTSSQWRLTELHTPDSIRDMRRRDYTVRTLSLEGPGSWIFSTSDLTDIIPGGLRAQLVPPQIYRLLEIE